LRNPGNGAKDLLPFPNWCLFKFFLAVDDQVIGVAVAKKRGSN
jgi:hypothetical protein